MPQQPSVTIPGKIRLCTPCGAGARNEGFRTVLISVPLAVSVRSVTCDLTLLTLFAAPATFCDDLCPVFFLRCFTFGIAYIQLLYFFC